MRLKIISDGTNAGTKVVNASTEEELEDVTILNWGICMDEGSEAIIHLSNLPCEIESDAIILGLNEDLT